MQIICFAQVYVFAYAKVYTLYKTYSFAYAKCIVLRMYMVLHAAPISNYVAFAVIGLSCACGGLLIYCNSMDTGTQT